MRIEIYECAYMYTYVRTSAQQIRCAESGAPRIICSVIPKCTDTAAVTATGKTTETAAVTATGTATATATTADKYYHGGQVGVTISPTSHDKREYGETGRHEKRVAT